jgi:hypothetical protein
MAGTITVSTISDGTNSTSATNCIKGSALAWVTWTGSSGATVQSYNVSSVTRVATGRYTIAFTNALPNTTYSIVLGADLGTFGGIQFQNQSGYSTTSINEIQCWRNDTSGYLDCTRGYVAVHGY